MSNQNDEILRDSPVRLRDEETPDVEGHIRKPHSVRVQAPVEGPRLAQNDEDGPDVEGHIVRL